MDWPAALFVSGEAGQGGQIEPAGNFISLMMTKIISALAKRTCYSFTVILISVAGGQAAALVGILYIIATVEFPLAGYLSRLFLLWGVLVLAAAMTHYLLYGLGSAVGGQWSLAWLKPLNRNMDGLSFIKDVPADDWPAVNRALEKMPIASTKLAVSLALGVVLVLVLGAHQIYQSTAVDLTFIEGGLIAVALYAMFSFTIIELVTNTARLEARRKLARLDPEALPPGRHRLSTKLGMSLVLILISVVISRGVFTTPRINSSDYVMAGFGIGILLLGYGVAVLIFLSIVRPLREIQESAALLTSANRAEFGSGSLDREFIDVARDVYGYARQIVQYRRELQELNQALEKRVTERTWELSRANLELEKKIEEVRQASLALRTSEEKHRLLVEKMQDGVFLIRNGRLTFANQAFADMVGYDVDELMQLEFEDLIAPDDLDRVKEYYRRRLSGNSVPELYEFQMVHRDGRTMVSVLLSVGLVQDAEGQTCSLGALKDVTALKAAEAERAKRARLEGVMAMAGAACHELNQPLQVACGQCEIALLGLTRDKNSQERFTIILEQLNRLCDLTGKIQRITRDETTEYLGGPPIIDIHRASTKD